jgi:hypothetical protein
MKVRLQDAERVDTFDSHLRTLDMAFISCPSCGCVVKLPADACVHCGSTLRDSEGKITKTAAAVVLGLALSAAACGDDTGTGGDGGFAAEYGVAGSGGVAATGGAGGDGGMGDGGFAAEYGVPGTGGGGMGEGGFAADYGVPGTGGTGGAP